MKSSPVVEACLITLSGLMLEPSEDTEETANAMAQVLWLVVVAFEAGRIYEGGAPE
jgi:hypothetical protein